MQEADTAEVAENDFSEKDDQPNENMPLIQMSAAAGVDEDMHARLKMIQMIKNSFDYWKMGGMHFPVCYYHKSI